MLHVFLYLLNKLHSHFATKAFSIPFYPNVQGHLTLSIINFVQALLFHVSSSPSLQLVHVRAPLEVFYVQLLA